MRLAPAPAQNERNDHDRDYAGDGRVGEVGLGGLGGLLDLALDLPELGPQVGHLHPAVRARSGNIARVDPSETRAHFCSFMIRLSAQATPATAVRIPAEVWDPGEAARQMRMCLRLEKAGHRQGQHHPADGYGESARESVYEEIVGEP